MRRARTLNFILEPLEGWTVEVGDGGEEVGDGGEVVDLEAVSMRHPNRQSKNIY
jgi:hypothetical protein